MKAGKDCIGVGCGAIILNEKKEVLLMKRSATARIDAGVWSRPGGQVEFGETGAQAVEREILEETGLTIRVTRTLEFTENISEDKSTHWIALGYLAEWISGELTNTEPDKHDEIRWFPLDALPEDLTWYTKQSIEEYRKSLF